MFFKKVLSLIIVSAMVFSLCACSPVSGKAPASEANAASDGPAEGEKAAEATVTVFAPEGAVLFLISAIEQYRKERPNVTVTASFDSSTVNAEKVISGYKCDLLIVDDSQILDFIDGSCGKDANPHGLDMIRDGSRTDICSVPLEDTDTSVVFSAAVLKKASSADETQKFLDFMLGCGDEVYAEYGYVKAE